MTDTRIYLSPPDVGDVERKLLLEAFDSNWVAPAGPDLDAFEGQVAELVGVRHAVALSSGTAAAEIGATLLRALEMGRWQGGNVYGDGRAGERIAQLLATIPLPRELADKTNAY